MKFIVLIIFSYCSSVYIHIVVQPVSELFVIFQKWNYTH